MSSDEAPSEQAFGPGDSGEDSADMSDSQDSESDGEDEEAYTEKNALEHLSFEERERLIAEGLGGRMLSAAGSAGEDKPVNSQRGLKRKADSVEEISKRLNKNAPVEMKISKRPVDVLRDSVQIKGIHRRDPRFAVTGQQGDDRTDRKRYAFLFNQKIPEEVKELKAQLKKEKDVGAQKRIQARMTRLLQSVRQEDDRRINDEVNDEWKKKEKAAIAEGKDVFHLKASERKKMVLAKQYEKLQKSGQLEAYMAKRRKRNAAKDHRKMPSRDL